MPKNSDAASVDYGIWCILKRRLQKNTLIGLKQAINTKEQNYKNIISTGHLRAGQGDVECHGAFVTMKLMKMM